MKPGGFVPAPPIAPGDVLRDDILSKLGVTQDQLAKAMRVSRFSVNQIINRKRSVTAEMALRLGQVTSTSPQLWLKLQTNFDLYQARLKLGSTIKELDIVRPVKTDADMFVDVTDNEMTNQN